MTPGHISHCTAAHLSVQRRAKSTKCPSRIRPSHRRRKYPVFLSSSSSASAATSASRTHPLYDIFLRLRDFNESLNDDYLPGGTGVSFFSSEKMARGQEQRAVPQRRPRPQGLPRHTRLPRILPQGDRTARIQTVLPAQRLQGEREEGGEWREEGVGCTACSFYVAG